MASTEIDTVVFDLGGVLVDWSPRHLYRRLFDGDEERVDDFLSRVCTQQWNERQDAGRPFAEGIRELCARFPEEAAAIRAYDERWEEMIPREIPGSVAVLHDVRAAGLRALGLSNWSAEKFPIARRRFAFLGQLEGIVLSGEVGINKPDPRIYAVLVERYGVAPGRAVYVDDHPPNASAARALGFHAVEFTDADSLRAALVALGVPLARVASGGERRE